MIGPGFPVLDVVQTQQIWLAVPSIVCKCDSISDSPLVF
jgi:hypothetical protein